MIVTQRHCDFAFAVARNARYEGLSLKQFQDLIAAAFEVLDANDKRIEELDKTTAARRGEG